MKKSRMTIVAVAVAIVMIFAMSSVAFAAEPTVALNNNAPKNGDKVTFTVALPDGDASMDASVTASSNLTFESVSGGFTSSESSFVLGNDQFGTVTYTYVVNGTAGEEFSFVLENVVCVADTTYERTDLTGSYSATGTIAETTSDGGGGTTEPPAGGTTPPAGGTTPPAGGTTPPAGGDGTTQTPAGGTTQTPAGGENAAADSKLDDQPKDGDAAQDMLVWVMIAAAAIGAVGFAAYRKAFSK